MSYLRIVLAGLMLLVSICQANTGGLRAGDSTTTTTTTQGKGLLTNAMVGLAAVTGFLFIVFILLIVKRVFFKKDTDEQYPELEVCVGNENKAFEVETQEKVKCTDL